jgi:cobaltochelatase CobN
MTEDIFAPVEGDLAHHAPKMVKTKAVRDKIMATLDYMFAFSATTGAVKSHHFDLAYHAFIADDAVRDFIEQSNPAALKEMAERFLEAMERGLWTAKSNSAKFDLERIAVKVG